MKINIFQNRSIKYKAIVWIISLLFCAVTVWASRYSPGGVDLGSAARNIIEPTSFLTKTIYAMCYVIGSALLIGSLVMYRMHRDNPLQTRLSQVIFLFVFGLAVVLIPIVAQLSEGAKAVGGTG